MARYIRRTAAIRPLAAIMACAGPSLRPAGRPPGGLWIAGPQQVRKPGLRRYGLRSAKRGKIDVYSHQARLEIVDDHGRPVSPGQVGRLLVTLLDNPSFPLIRYEIGDMAALDPGRCPCGRPFPLLDKLEGRRLEFLANSRGGSSRRCTFGI